MENKSELIFSALAHQELNDTVSFYNLQHEGLGKRFRNEVKKASNRIINHPKAWSKERGEIRKYLLHNFPYKILYSIEEDHIFVIAIAHQHRKPDYWIDEYRS